LLLGLIAIVLGCITSIWLAVSRPSRQDGTVSASGERAEANGSLSAESRLDPASEVERSSERRGSRLAATSETPSAPANEGSQVGALIISLTADGHPVRGGELQIEKGSGEVSLGSERTPVDSQTGEARFESLRPGLYHLAKLSGVPDGWMAPWNADDPKVSWRVWSGVRRVQLPLVRGAHVFGTVRDSHDEPLSPPITFIPLDETGAPRGAQRIFSAPKGRYEGDLESGLWLATNMGRDVRGSPMDDTDFPQEVLRLEPGAKVQVDFVAESGQQWIEGHVVDEDGNPFGGLLVACTRVFDLKIPGTDREIRRSGKSRDAKADEAGSFRVEGLAKGRYRVCVDGWRQFDPFSKPDSPRSFGRIGGAPRCVTVELPDAKSSALELVARRSSPVRVQVEVEVDADWRKREAIPTFLPDVRVLTDDVWEDGSPVRTSLSIHDGRFETYFEASLTSPRFELSLGKTVSTYPIVVPPNSHLFSMRVRFPQ
jgi:hypothetical protein